MNNKQEILKESIKIYDKQIKEDAKYIFLKSLPSAISLGVTIAAGAFLAKDPSTVSAAPFAVLPFGAVFALTTDNFTDIEIASDRIKKNSYEKKLIINKIWNKK